MKKWTHRYIVLNGAMIPNKYGVSYYRPWLGDSVCHRIPLNVIIRIGWLTYLWFLCPFRGWEPKWWKRKYK